MTPSEFKAWFEGFTESMDGPPSLKQWERIQARVKQITGAPTTYPVFVDRYVPRPAPIWWYQNGSHSGIAYCRNESVSISDASSASSASLAAISAQPIGTWLTGSNGDGGTVFDAHAAMNALGKADAADLKAA